MARQHHDLKLQTEYFGVIENGVKKFELRKNNRDFKKGDIVNFSEMIGEMETGRKLTGYEIKYVFQGGQFGINSGYCIFNW